MNNSSNNTNMQQVVTNIVNQVNRVVAQTKNIVNSFQTDSKVENIDMDLLRKRVVDLYDIITSVDIKVIDVSCTETSQTNTIIENEEENTEPVEEATKEEEIVKEEKEIVKEHVELIIEEEEEVIEEEENEIITEEESHNDKNIDDEPEEQLKDEPKTKEQHHKEITGIFGKTIIRPTFTVVPQQTIADKLSSHGTTIGDRLTVGDTASTFAEKPIKDIKSALTLNDKLMLTKELFDNNSDKFNRAVNILNGFGNKGEAAFFLDSLKKELGWADEMEGYIKLKTIVDKKRY